MSVDIPAEYLPFVQKAVASGRYESEGAIIGEGLKLLALSERELELVQKGFDDIERGDYIELDDEGLAKFFEDIKREGRERLRAQGRSDV
jgi:Arc/MetJ-type ribon-helix-helix transcriptional regulator